MPEKKYKLEYLPRFYSDLESAVLYIAQTLQNPGAEEHLLRGKIERHKVIHIRLQQCSLPFDQ